MHAVLYMGALVAARRNPIIREFYQRPPVAGKPKPESTEGMGDGRSDQR